MATSMRCPRTSWRGGSASLVGAHDEDPRPAPSRPRRNGEDGCGAWGRPEAPLVVFVGGGSSRPRHRAESQERKALPAAAAMRASYEVAEVTKAISGKWSSRNLTLSRRRLCETALRGVGCETVLLTRTRRPKRFYVRRLAWRCSFAVPVSARTLRSLWCVGCPCGILGLNAMKKDDIDGVDDASHPIELARADARLLACSAVGSLPTAL